MIPPEPAGLRGARVAACLAAAWRRGNIVILDVRRPLEWAASHIDGAVHIPLHELPARLSELPPGGTGRPTVWVHCQGGYRASVAASLLAAAGHRVAVVDDYFGRAAGAGLPLTGDAVRRAPAASWPLMAAG